MEDRMVGTKLKAVDTGTEGAEMPTDTGTRPLGILGKVLELQKRIGTFQKDAKNTYHEYAFASAKGVNEKIRPVLLELGLVIQTHTDIKEVTQAGLVVSQTVIVLIDVETKERMDFSSIGSGIDRGDKAAMKAATASQKYATIGMVFGATGDDPEADARTDMAGTYPTVGAPRAPSVRTNRPDIAPPRRAPVAGEAPVTQTSQNAPIALDGGFVVTVDVDNVFDGRPAKSGGVNRDGTPKTGPGTVLGTDGNRYDTFDKDLLALARQAKGDGYKVTIMYTYDEQWKKNTIVEDGLTLFGDGPQEGEELQSLFTEA